MATQTRTKSTEQEFQQVADRLRQLNEQTIENGQKAGNVYLDLYERTLKSFADLEEKVGSVSQVELVAEIAKAQASFTREFAEASTSAARELLK